MKLTVFVLSLALCVVWVHGSWMQQPYNDDSFNLKRTYLDNVTLMCEDNVNRSSDYTAMYWILPDLKIMFPDERDEFLTIDGFAGVQVSTNGTEIEVFLIQESQFGFYYCVINDTYGDLHTIKRALNYKGPFFGDLWDKYKDNVIISCSSAAAFLVMAISMCVVYEKKFAVYVPNDVGKVSPLKSVETKESTQSTAL